jgi:hypothetical protein
VVRWRSGRSATARSARRASTGVDVVEAGGAALLARERVGLVDGHGAQPAEQRLGALGLAAQEDRPRGGAGVLDQRLGGAHGAAHRAQ